MDIDASKLRVGDVVRTDLRRLYQYYYVHDWVCTNNAALGEGLDLVKINDRHVLICDGYGIAAVDDDYVEVVEVNLQEEFIGFEGWQRDEPAGFNFGLPIIKYGIQSRD